MICNNNTKAMVIVNRKVWLRPNRQEYTFIRGYKVLWTPYRYTAYVRKGVQYALLVPDRYDQEKRYRRDIGLASPLR